MPPGFLMMQTDTVWRRTFDFVLTFGNINPLLIEVFLIFAPDYFHIMQFDRAGS